MSLDGNESSFNHLIRPVDVNKSSNSAPLLSVLEESQLCPTSSAKLLVLQQIEDEPRSPTCPSSLTDACPVSLARLIVDREDDDYYVVSHADIIDEHAQSNVTSDSTLFSLFSRPINDEDPHTRFLRCSRDDLPDFKDWAAQQQYDPTIVPERNSPMDTDSATELTSEEKALYQKELISAFQPWEQSQQHLAAMTLYCVAHSLRDLATPELVAAVKLGMKITSRTADFVHDSDQFASHVELCISNMSQLFAQRAGKLVFKNEKMKVFIRQLKLLDIQPGHSTMTRICFQQIKELGAALMFHPWHRFKEWFGSVSEWPLVGYVVKNWFIHYRNTTDRADIDSELYHLVREGALVQMPSHPSMHVERRIVDAGLGISQIYGLPGLEAVLRNMGARTALAKTSVLGKDPTKSQWMRLSATYDNWMASHDSRNDDEIEICEDNVDGLVVVQFRRLSLNAHTTDDETTQINTFDTAGVTPNVLIKQDAGAVVCTIGQMCNNDSYIRNDEGEADTTMVDEV